MYKILGGRYVVDAMGVIRSNQTGSLMQTIAKDLNVSSFTN
jgi:hypothetical protein